MIEAVERGHRVEGSLKMSGWRIVLARVPQAVEEGKLRDFVSIKLDKEKGRAKSN